MRQGSLLFTTELVSEGHPDKIVDQILDRVLDAFLVRDPGARVACEALLADQLVVVAGEFRARRGDLPRHRGGGREPRAPDPLGHRHRHTA